MPALMKLRTVAVRIWKDPIAGGLIATAIVAAFGFWLDLSENPIIRFAIPGLVGLFGFMIWRHFRVRKILVFLSRGGTCRDPMAKAIATEVLHRRFPDNKKLLRRIEFVAAGLGPLNSGEASYGARAAIEELYGENLLKNHQPELLSPALAEKADLILAMDSSLVGKNMPQKKTYLLKEFLGEQGDIDDPWRQNQMHPDTLNNYRICAAELQRLLETHFDKIIKYLNPK